MKIVEKDGYKIVEPDCGTFSNTEELIALKEFAANPDNDCQGFYAEQNGMVFDCEKGNAVPIAEKGIMNYILCVKATKPETEIALLKAQLLEMQNENAHLKKMLGCK